MLIPGGCTSVVQPLDVSLNKPFKAYVRAEWLTFMEKAVLEAEEAEAELSDDPLASSDEEGEENADVLQLLSRTPRTAVVVKPASRQTLTDWIVSAWKKMEQRPALVSKSFEVTGITKSKDDTSVRNPELQDEIAAGFDVNIESDLEEESEDEGNEEEEDENEEEEDGDEETADSDTSEDYE